MEQDELRKNLREQRQEGGDGPAGSETNPAVVFAGEELEEEDSLEIQTRMKNLMWTVSGDYRLDTKLDLQSFRESRYVSMYDAIKQGAFARFLTRTRCSLPGEKWFITVRMKCR